MKIDLHVHTSEVSGCAKVPAAEMVDIYKNEGYDLIVTTDHFTPYFAEEAAQSGQCIKDAYLAGYRAAKAEGDRIGLKVLLGCEINFKDNPNDYLLFGIDESFFKDGSMVYKNPKEFSIYAKEHDILFYQAHPFRMGMKITKPDYLFGIEVNNGNPRHNSHNNIARQWAFENSLHQISGSDFHEHGDQSRGGIITSRIIENMNDLKKVLKDDDYVLITTI